MERLRGWRESVMKSFLRRFLLIFVPLVVLLLAGSFLTLTLPIPGNDGPEWVVWREEVKSSISDILVFPGAWTGGGSLVVGPVIWAAGLSLLAIWGWNRWRRAGDVGR